MSTVRKFIENIWAGTKKSDFHKAWDRERAMAQKFGPSHVLEVDTIFARHQESH